MAIRPAKVDLKYVPEPPRIGCVAALVLILAAAIYWAFW